MIRKILTGRNLIVSIMVLAIVLSGLVALGSFSNIAAQESAPTPTPTPTLTTDKQDYFPGETVIIYGNNFEPSQQLVLKISGGSGADYTETVADVTADEQGSFIYFYQLENIWRPLYTIVASNSSGQELARTTFTDDAGMGADKAVYRLDTGVWSTGNAGTTVEGEWISYQYSINKINASEPLPDFKITYPVYVSSNTPGIYFDLLSNALYCIDDGDGNCKPQGGSTPGVLPDGTPRPTSRGSGAGQWTNFTPQAVNAAYGCTDPSNPINGGTPGVDSPCVLHSFSVVPGQGGVPTNIGSYSQITFFFEFHLAQTPLWANHLEANFGPGEANAIPAHANALNTNVLGADLYNAWTHPFDGSGISSQGSSQHVNITDFHENGTQKAPGGTLTLPIPTVEPTLASTVSGQKFLDVNGNGHKDAGDSGLSGWTITLSGTLIGGVPVSFPTTTDASGNYILTNIYPGTYQLGETLQGGYTQTAPNNTPTGQLPNGSALPTYVTRNVGNYTIAIPAGASATLANLDFGNRNLGYLTVNKVLDPAADAGLFNLRIGSTTYASDVGNNGTTGAVQLTPGSYNVNETAGTGTSLGNYTSVISGDCAADGSVTIAAGDNKTCTITNHRLPKLTVNKVLDPAADPGLFNLRIGSTTYASDVGNNGTTGAVQLDTGPYNVNETAGTGTNLGNYTSVISGDCALNGDVSLSYGDNKTCTITNTRLGRITIIKDAVPNDLYNFTFNGTGGIGQFTLDDDEGVVDDTDSLGNQTTFNNLNVNTSYTITEQKYDYWQLQTPIACTGIDTSQISQVAGSNDIAGGVTITLYPADEATCTFVNNKIGATRTLGFWKNHTTFTLNIFNTLLNGTMTIGNSTTGHFVQISGPTGNATLLGAYCANNAQLTTGKGKNNHRTDIDQARMILLKQLITAKLNCAAFGCSSDIQSMIATADNNYSVGNAAAILASANALDLYNNSGDTIIFSPPLPKPGSATPNQSCGTNGIGNAAAWDDPSPGW